MGLKIIDGTPTAISKFIREQEAVDVTPKQDGIGLAHLKNPPICYLCKKPMLPVKDSITKTITGYCWKCKCMPPNMTLLLC